MPCMCTAVPCEMQATGRRGSRVAGHPDARTVRYRIRTTVEMTNARLKDEFGARHVRVRGPTKVACHLMFGLLTLTADQIIRLAAL